MYKLSIVIPHYNSPKKLLRLLKSIPEKPGYQVIVVDDNSDIELNVKCLKHPNIEIYKNNKKGAGSARNLGLSKVKGEWVVFADADDYFTINAFDYIEEHLNAGLSKNNVVFFTPVSINENSGLFGNRHKRYEKLVRKHIERDEIDTEMHLRLYYLVPWSKLMSKALIQEQNISFDDILFSNDVMFSLKLGHVANNVIADDRSIYCVTEDLSSLTGNLSQEAFECRFLVGIRYNNFLRNHGYKKYMVSMYKYIKWSKRFGILFFVNTLIEIVKQKNPILPRKFRLTK